MGWYLQCHHVHSTKGVHRPLALHPVMQCPAPTFSTSTVCLLLPFCLTHRPCLLGEKQEDAFVVAGCRALLEPMLRLCMLQPCFSPPMSMCRCR